MVFCFMVVFCLFMIFFSLFLEGVFLSNFLLKVNLMNILVGVEVISGGMGMVFLMVISMVWLKFVELDGFFISKLEMLFVWLMLKVMMLNLVVMVGVGC